MGFAAPHRPVQSTGEEVGNAKGGPCRQRWETWEDREARGPKREVGRRRKNNSNHTRESKSQHRSESSSCKARIQMPVRSAAFPGKGVCRIRCMDGCRGWEGARRFILWVTAVVLNVVVV